MVCIGCCVVFVLCFLCGGYVACCVDACCVFFNVCVVWCESGAPCVLCIVCRMSFRVRPLLFVANYLQVAA